MAARQAGHSGLTSIWVRMEMACALALALVPRLAVAKATITLSPRKPPATMNFTVLSDGTIQGKQTLSVTITRKEKPSAILQACTKIRYITVKAFDHRRGTGNAGWVDMRNHPLCNFTKTITYYPFDGDVIRGLCLGNSATHTIKSNIILSFSHQNYDEAPTEMNYGRWETDGITAHITCATGNGASTQSPPSANVHPVNTCNLGGNWPVWQTAPGRQAAIPFVLTANQGRNDIYQVSTPNSAGVAGTALVNGYKVTISLQGNGTQMQSFSGSFNRSCSTLSGQAVASEPPVRLSATRRGGSARNNTTRSVHASHSSSAPAKARRHSSVWKPHVNTRVNPKWNTQLR